MIDLENIIVGQGMKTCVQHPRLEDMTVSNMLLLSSQLQLYRVYLSETISIKVLGLPEAQTPIRCVYLLLFFIEFPCYD